MLSLIQMLSALLTIVLFLLLVFLCTPTSLLFP